MSPFFPIFKLRSDRFFLTALFMFDGAYLGSMLMFCFMKTGNHLKSALLNSTNQRSVKQLLRIVCLFVSVSCTVDISSWLLNRLLKTTNMAKTTTKPIRKDGINKAKHSMNPGK